MSSRPSARILFTVWWLLLVAAAIATRSLTPVDETRYVTVAWEMLLRGDFLVPHLNGELYSHKPPLMFWLFNLGWAVFGVNEWWPRVIVPAFGLGSLWLTIRLARMLWPDRGDVRAMAPLITGGAALWVAFTAAVMFDLMLAFFVSIAMVGLLSAYREGGRRGWIVFGVGIGLGILAKGPVMLLHALPAAALAPWWAEKNPYPQWQHWYRGVLGGVGIGAAIALAWALPAAIFGGPQFRYEIFWYQTADRMVHSFAHVRPAWWYVMWLPLLLFPWLFWLPLWKGLGGLFRAPQDVGVRFAVAWAVPVFVAFSLISGKQVHYLLPEFPAFALIAAYGLSRLPAAPSRLPQALVGLLFIGLAIWLALEADNTRLAHLVAAHDQYLVLLTAGGCALIGLALLIVRTASTVHATAVLGTASVVLLIALNFGLLRAIGGAYDMAPISGYLAKVQQEDRPIAHSGKYHGQYQFIGRLKRPLVMIHAPQDVLKWAAEHPNGSVVVYSRSELTHPTAKPEFTQLYRGKRVYVWRATDLPGVSDDWTRDGDSTVLGDG